MAAANTDKFKKAKRRFSTTVGVGGFTAGATTLPLSSTSGLDTDTAITLVLEPGTSNEEVITGVVNGSNVINCVRGKEGTTDVTHTAGSAVSMYFTETHWDDLINGILVAHNQDGTQATDSVTTTSIVNNAVTTAKLSTTLQGNISNGWISIANTPNTITYNGNRNYDLVFNSVDLSGTLSVGQKMKLSRTVAAPYRCTSLNGTSQYYSKSSPNKCTFTSAFAALGWVKLNAYGAGAIIGRDSTGASGSGWELTVNGNGTVTIYARNATGNIVGTTYSSLPLNKWVHVAGSLNAATGAITIWFDGISMSISSSAAGTTIVQASTDLTIGKRNSGSSYLNGKLAQVALFSSTITEANVRSYISQGLSGSESNTVSSYSFDGSKTDLNTTTPNDLTASGSAVETTADSPFANALTAGTDEYAEIHSVTYSTNTTVNVRVPDTCMIPTSGGISSAYYSIANNPYGLPYFSSILGYAQITVSDTTGGTAEADVNGLSVTVNVPTNARVRLTANCNTYNTTSSGYTLIRIKESTTTYTVGNAAYSTSNHVCLANPSVDIYPTAGSHTYKISQQTAAGNKAIEASTTEPAYIQVELVR